MVEGSGVEPQKIISIRNRGKPYSFVYDITTEDGNFFAGDILIHNCPWFPIDSEPIPPSILERVRYAFSRIVYSRFAEKQMQDHDLDCFYVPHGTNTELFKPLSPEDRKTIRGHLGFDKDAFIVGMVAANKGYPSRKAFEQNIAAFKELKKKHSDAVLYLHTLTGEHGGDCVNLPEYCKTLGLKQGSDVLFAEQFTYMTTGFPDPHMAALYNSFDVLLSVSRGEGFGIPILEAQATGCPVIVGDWTSMSELCFSGWKVDKKDATPDYTRLASYQYLPHIGAIAEKLRAAYNKRGDEDFRLRARVRAEEYDVKRITENYWKPTLEAIGNKIQRIEALRAAVSVPVAKPEQKIEVKEITA